MKKINWLVCLTMMVTIVFPAFGHNGYPHHAPSWLHLALQMQLRKAVEVIAPLPSDVARLTVIARQYANKCRKHANDVLSTSVKMTKNTKPEVKDKGERFVVCIQQALSQNSDVKHLIDKATG